MKDEPSTSGRQSPAEGGAVDRGSRAEPQVDGRFEDDRSELAKRMSLVSRVTTPAVGLALLVLAGRWLDRQLGLGAAFVFVGAAVGLILFFWQLFQLVQDVSRIDS